MARHAVPAAVLNLVKFYIRRIRNAATIREKREIRIELEAYIASVESRS
jgi:hypothetical protein